LNRIMHPCGDRADDFFDVRFATIAKAGHSRDAPRSARAREWTYAGSGEVSRSPGIGLTSARRSEHRMALRAIMYQL